MQSKLTKTKFRPAVDSLSSEWQLIGLLAMMKFAIHMVTFSNFELHRDAYLYYAQSEHLAWGYFSVPPFIAVVGKLATAIFGDTTFALRFFPMVVGAINVVIIGVAVKELGGKKIAIALAGLAYILSPAYLHANTLFQPVSFNHFFWLLATFLMLKMVNRSDPRQWLWIGLVFGLGFLNKYSIVFLYAAFGLALLLSKHRRLIWTRQFLMAAGLALVIILPNLIWQAQHHWPVIHHMTQLRESQLVHVNRIDFLIDQLLMNSHAIFIWILAVVVLLFVDQEKNFRLFGLTFILILLLLLLGSGKSYYSLGIYPLLFVFGAFHTEKYIRRFLLPVAGFLVAAMLLVLYASLSFDGIPFVTYEQALKKDAYRWEDGEYHDLSQDMADMTGWKELGEAVGVVYGELDETRQNNCFIFCDNYGQAGAVMFYGKKQGIPQPASLNDSFMFWSPDKLDVEYVIWVHSSVSGRIDPEIFLTRHFEEVQLKYTIQNPYFRENGSQVFLCKHPTDELRTLYQKRLAEERGEAENESSN